MFVRLPQGSHIRPDLTTHSVPEGEDIGLPVISGLLGQIPTTAAHKIVGRFLIDVIDLEI
jgi:hypothetical protein